MNLACSRIYKSSYIFKKKNIFSTEREINNQDYIALQLAVKHSFYRIIN